MISLQTGIKRKDKIKCILGYSGKIIDPYHLEQNLNSRPEIMLMHGDKDEVVKVEFFLEAKEFFNKIIMIFKAKFLKIVNTAYPQRDLALVWNLLKKIYIDCNKFIT